jgi:PhnB protein
VPAAVYHPPLILTSLSQTGAWIMTNPTPHLTVRDAAAAIDFYERAFGAIEQLRFPTPDGRKIMHARLALPDGGAIMLNDEMCETAYGNALTLHLDLPDVDAGWARAVAAGATVVMPLADQFWGDRYGVLVDPFGHRWSLSTHKRDPSAEEMAEGARRAFGA